MTAVDTNTPLALPADSAPSHRQSLSNGNNTLATPRGDPEALSTISSLTDLEARCGGCRNVIDQDNGGIVVAFGSSLWHVDCFRCAKCQEKVSADTNLLLLSDGSPVCGNCSYQCFVCKQAITEEAIMTGDESYHAHCFTCRTCKRRIEELVFAKTTQGIYCMSCHNDRVARSRRHAEAKRQRAARKEREAREKADGELRRAEEQGGRMTSSSTSTSLNVLANTVSRSSTEATVAAPSPMGSTTASPRDLPDRKGSLPPVSPQHNSTLPAAQRALSVDRAGGPASPNARSPSPSPGGRKGAGDPNMPTSPTIDAPLMSRGQSLDQPPPRSSSASPAPPAAAAGSSNSLSPASPINTISQSLSGSPSTPNQPHSPTSRQAGNPGLGVGLSVPTPKASKRRSINPGMTFNMDAHNATFAAEPRASSPLRAANDDAQQQRIVSGSPAPGTPSQDPKDRAASPVPPLIGTPNAQSTPVVEAATVPNGSGADEKENKDPQSKLDVKGKKGELDGSASDHEDRAAAAAAADGDATKQGPRIDAPALPTMSFSLSDPDFAVLLKEMESSPKKKGSVVPEVVTSSGSPNPQAPSDLEDANSAPMSRSPNMNLSAAANGQDKSLLSPSNVSGLPGGSTHRRRLSMESAVSVRLGAESALSSLKELMSEAKGDTVTVDRDILNEVIREHDALRDITMTLKNKYTGAKRSSQQYSEGLTVAGEEYDKEVAMRQELEAEVTRLRAQVHGQTARLSVISSEERRAENMRRRSHDLASNLTGLERDISRLRAQRDISLAEVEELHAKKVESAVGGSTDEATSKLGRSLTRRLDTIKEQYRDELGPLSAQREALQREINDLRDTREQFLEESTALAAKNEELAELNAQLSRNTESMQDSMTRRAPAFPHTTVKAPRGHPSGSPSMSSLANALQDVPEETARVIKVSKPVEVEAAPVRRFKWIGGGKSPKAELAKPAVGDAGGGNRKYRPSTEMGVRDHQFQQHSTMRLGRCELCQDKMWGLQEVKCASCGVVCHSKCAEKLPRSCPGKAEAEDGPPPVSMFGRDLSEQAESDGTAVPTIVTKCIRAVEANGMEYEGIYRKTGGSSQSKQITQLFERARYDTFDLTNVESFNDISSITSVLKTYFRQLPDPLMTHTLHESFVAAANIRDHANKHAALCVLLKELPKHHYNTLKVLMLHLNRVTAKSGVNLMTSQNLGVVFGPTLLRSKDPGREFGDMAGKALSVQWMVDNAPTVFVDEDDE